MNQAGIIIAGALIAVAIMLANHWTLLAGTSSTPGHALLLNRWTRTVLVCLLNPQQSMGELACPRW